MPRKEHGVHALPNARSVSVALAGQNDRTELSKTLAFMQWSQFVAHDISFTPARQMGQYFTRILYVLQFSFYLFQLCT